MANNRIRNSYMYGSAAPAYPSHAPGKTEKVRRNYRAEARMKIEEKVDEKRHARREISAPYLIILISAAAIVISAASLFLVEKSINSDVKRSIAALQREYQNVLQDNVLKENMIEKQIDYTEVYRYATDVLHMTVPAGHQVVGYVNTAEEYVVKNGSIPHE